MDKKSLNKLKLKLNQPTAVFKKGFNKKNIEYLYPTLIVLSLNIVFIIILILVSKMLPPQVPLYYGLPRGEQQLVSPTTIVLPIVLSSLFIVINSTIAYFTESLFLKRVLVFGSYFASLLSIITITNIIFLIVSI
jgi:hypothetical protein